MNHSRPGASPKAADLPQSGVRGWVLCRKVMLLGVAELFPIFRISLLDISKGPGSPLVSSLRFPGNDQRGAVSGPRLHSLLEMPPR